MAPIPPSVNVWQAALVGCGLTGAATATNGYSAVHSVAILDGSVGRWVTFITPADVIPVRRADAWAINGVLRNSAGPSTTIIAAPGSMAATPAGGTFSVPSLPSPYASGGITNVVSASGSGYSRGNAMGGAVNSTISFTSAGGNGGAGGSAGGSGAWAGGSGGSYPVTRSGGRAGGKTSWEHELTSPKPRPERKQDDPIRAYKGAYVELSGKTSVTPVFTGMSSPFYYTREGYARCNNGHRTDQMPVMDCVCGFWAMADPEEAVMSDGSSFLLTVELHGRVSTGRNGKGDAVGYRGSWQRVLSARVPDWCIKCGGPAVALGVNVSSHYGPRRKLMATCAAHTVAPIPHPLSWLREHLGVDIIAGFMTDDAPAPAGSGGGYTGDADIALDNLSRGMQRMSDKVASLVEHVGKMPALTAGRSWRKFLPGTPPTVIDISVAANNSLSIACFEVNPEGEVARLLWQEHLPL